MVGVRGEVLAHALGPVPEVVGVIEEERLSIPIARRFVRPVYRPDIARPPAAPKGSRKPRSEIPCKEVLHLSVPFVGKIDLACDARGRHRRCGAKPPKNLPITYPKGSDPRITWRRKQ